jgi:hypothetical protein
MGNESPIDEEGVDLTGFEPVTFRMQSGRSAVEPQALGLLFGVRL